MCTLLQRPAMPTSPSLNPLSSQPPSPTIKSNPNCFTFNAGPLPLPLPLSFALPPANLSSPNFTFSLAAAAPRPDAQCSDNPLKRRRRLTDVDGDLTSATLRKKRRLRLTLITSRLSQPFSSPATNIVDRGQNKAAVWARIRKSRLRGGKEVFASLKAGTPSSVGTNVAGIGMPEPLLRKAAILNRLRLQGKLPQLRMNTGEPMASDAPLRCQLQLQEPKPIAPCVTDEPFVETLTTETERIESPNIAAQMAVSKEPYKPVSPSPLGISNYDALDLEDDFPEDEELDYEASDAGTSGSERRGSFYSDFSVFDADADDAEDDGFGSLGFSAIPR